MLNFEMNLKRVNDKYYVNDIEVSKEEYIDAETVLNNYLEEKECKDKNDINELIQNKINGDIVVNDEFIERYLKYDWLHTLGILPDFFYTIN